MDHTLITSELATFPSDFAAFLIVLASAWSPPEPGGSLPFKSALLDRKCLCSTGSLEKWNISFCISKQGCHNRQQLQPLWIVSWRALRKLRVWKHRVCCCCSVAQSCLTLYNPMDCSTPGFPLLRRLPEFAQTHIQSVMPSNHLILCHPLLLLHSIFPKIRVFSDESSLCIRWPNYGSFSISPSNEFSVDFLQMDWFLSLLSKKLLRVWPQIPELLIKGMISVSPDSCHLFIHRKVLNS